MHRLSFADRIVANAGAAATFIRRRIPAAYLYNSKELGEYCSSGAKCSPRGSCSGWWRRC